ncbi:hypothetical protein COU76_04595 [Candidatus Peregrinibacteria bacterium CG10_big_fil_rev_8_21_14_0_10_49_10]|nr:MAG: hypothetical protein COU76_04595 [Candidatus Peregrinibacteria bacterium CG10_big_fil_rev_8_21_14_0_10_49_10]
MHARRCSYTFLLSFLIGIFLLQWNQQKMYPPDVWELLLMLGALGAVSVCIPQTRKMGGIALAMALGIAVSLSTVERTTHVPTALTVDTYATEQFVKVYGTIAAEPDRRPMQTKYTVDVHQIQTASGTILFPVQGKVLATYGSWPRFAYGEDVVVQGTLQAPRAIETFQYDRYLSRYGVYAVIYRAGMQKKQSVAPKDDIWARFKSSLFTLKDHFEYRINTLYAEPHASFMAGLLTGSRRGIPDALLKDFNTTGLTHIIAISGYNITIVITMISGMLFWLPLKKRFFPAVAAIIAFTLFVGASAAIVRASIMGILGLLALQTGRQSEVRLSVLWTLFFMLLWNPKYLWYDAGFQLSFLAVLGLIEVAPLLDPLFQYIPQTLGIREALQMTVSAQLSAVPLIIFLFGRLSLIAPIANLLVAPFIPLAMLFGFLGTVASFVWFPLGQMLSYIAWGCLEWIVIVAHQLSNIPFSSVELGKISSIVIVGYYCLLLLVLYRHQRMVACY